MNSFYALLLGVLQGFTEFLPISSSGHLVIAQSIIPNFQQPGVLFDVVLHAGTTLSVLIFFREKLKKLSLKYVVLLAIATIPAAIVGLLFQSSIESFFSSLKLVGIALLLTALMNFLIDRVKSEKRNVTKQNALMIGLFQALAIIPGISRSGSTIFAGSRLGINKNAAAEFSFLLSIPAILGASFFQFISHKESINFDLNYIVGFVAAFASGFSAITLVYKLLSQKKFKYFGLYCLILGYIVLVSS